MKSVCEGCGEIHPVCYCDIKPKNSAGERPIDATEDYMSNCCDVSFTYPGWPDSDICSECFEHAGVSEDG